MVYFDGFPVELIVQQLQESDFVGIKSLREVHSRVDDIVKENAAHIFRGLRNSHPVLVTDQCRNLFRRIALINHQSVLCHNIDEYILLLSIQTSTDLLLKNNPELSTYMFDLGAQIQRLACACLTTLHDKLDTALYPASDSTLAGEEELYGAAYSFSWVEEYRVYRALWYMCYHSDLHDALDRWNWPSESISRLNESIIMLHIKGFIIYEIRQVKWALKKLGLRCVAEPRWFRTKKGPLPLFPTITSFSAITPFSCAEYPVWPCPTLPAESDGNDIWGRSFHASQAQSQALRCLWLCSIAVLNYATYFAVPHISTMRLFQSLGLFIWDDRRMFTLGLVRLVPIGPRPGTLTPARRLHGPAIPSSWTRLYRRILGLSGRHPNATLPPP